MPTAERDCIAASDDSQCGEDCCIAEHDDVQYIVGSCIPDGEGGCKRSERGTAASCCAPTGALRDPCCASVAPEENCTDDDECCSDCAPASAEKEACADGCCSDVPLASGPVSGTTAKVLSECTDDDECCSDCAPEIAEKESCPSKCCSDVSPSPDAPDAASDTTAKVCSSTQPVRRRRVVHRASAPSDHRDGPKAAHGRHREHGHDQSKCGLESTFGRFFEAACCCLVDWRTKARRAPHHKHKERRQAAVPPPTASGLAGAELGGAHARTLLLSVRGMDCPSCASKLTRALLTLPSISDVKVNMFTNTATLRYTEGLAFPPDIARRATTLTGFTCAVLEEQAHDERNRTMRVAVNSDDGSWEKGLPSGASVRRATRERTRTILELEYDADVVQPRAVLAALSSWGGTFLPSPKPTASAQAAKELHTLLLRTAVSAALCIPVLVLAWAPLPAHPRAYGGCSLALTTLIQVYAGAPIYSSALRALFLQRLLDTDALVALSSGTAYAFSVAAYAAQLADAPFSTSFFETPALLLTLVTLGRLISALARRRATAALDGVRGLQAESVEFVDVRTGTVVVLAAELVHRKDVLRVGTGCVVPTDGTVVSGASLVDEASITGESAPVEKGVGARLTAGTLNVSAVLDMRVERVPADNTIADIGRLVAQVQDSRLRVQDLADRVAGWLAPFILVAAAVVFAVWVAVGVCVRGEGARVAGIAALRYAIAVLVVSCPCALVLCVPMVVVISAAVAAKEGVLFKSATAVQHVGGAEIAVFDKTGTLTTGKLTVVESHIEDDASLSVILGLVSGNQHPVAQALAKHLASNLAGTEAVILSDWKSIPGQGIEARHGNVRVRGGSPSWLGNEDHPTLRAMRERALTLFAVTAGHHLVAAFGLSDTVRPSARDAITLLRRQGCDVYIVSGDTQPSVDALASALDVSRDHAIGGCLPDGKLERVRRLQGQRKGATVLFIGDGTNDCLALAQADVGVSLSSGTDVALSAADVVVLDLDGGADLARALRVVSDVSRGAVRRIKANFAWAVVYNVLAVLLAAGVFVHVRIAPEYAGLGEVVSVVPVVLIAWSMWVLRK